MRNKKNIVNITLTAIFAAMVIILSSFSLPVPGGHLYLNDVAIVIAAILLKPAYAFIACGVGAFLGDFIFYPTPMFVSLVTHGIQAIVISIFAHYILKNRKFISCAIGTVIGALIMVFGYTIGRAFLYSTLEVAIIKLPYQFLQAGVGVVAGLAIVFPCGLLKIYNKMIK